MLEAWIIEEIKRREREKEERPFLELPIFDPEYEEEIEEEFEYGIVRIQL